MNDSKNLCLIIGAMPRCGSNYLNKLILKHPATKKGSVVGEDKMLVNAHLIQKYIQLTHDIWLNDTAKDKDKKRLTNEMSIALNKFLINSNNGSNKLIISKTPLTQGINLINEFFKDAKVIILIRNGRDAIESGRKSFAWPYDVAINRYSNSLSRIKYFIESENTNRSNIKVVKYEELFKNEKKSLEEILNFLSLDPNLYPFEEIQNMPVIGSSQSKNENDKNLNWKGFKKTETFDPTKRSSNWPKYLERNYYKKCTRLLLYFGYEAQTHQIQSLNNLTDPILILINNLKGIFKRAQHYSISRIFKTIKSRIIRAFTLLIYGQ